MILDLYLNSEIKPNLNNYFEKMEFVIDLSEI